ncbi:MAG: LytTR family transcriptional regulator DNA-binding domain-containing protein [Bacteroidales bacterium]|nr:LytTR family transcriptional regulator DNA-binding domain-containing protein [Candidatus Liminaster caballi]
MTILTFTSCSDDAYHRHLLLAEEQVTQNADSCARLLEAIPIDELHGEDEALYGLVHSWLLYRQYAKEIPEEPLQKAYDYYHDSRDPHRRAQVFFLHSVISQDQKRGQPSQWMEDLYSACLAIGETDDYLLASQIYQNYGSRLTQIDRFDEGLVWIEKFVDAAQKSGHRGEYVHALIMKSHNRLYAEGARVKQELQTSEGAAIAQHANFEAAFAPIYTALAIARQYGMELELGRIYNQLSVCHSRCQQSDSTLFYARLSVLLNEKLYAQGKRKELPHYLALADAYRKMGNADSAIFYARKTFETPGMPLRNRRVAAQLIYNTYDDLKGDYQASLHWMRIFNQLKDSIDQGTIASNLKAVQDAAASEHENAVLRTEKQHTIHWLLWISAICFLVISAISYRLYHNRRLYHRHIHELEDDFNRRINEQNFAIQNTEIRNEERIVLTGSTREQIEIEPSSILFLTSESNYVKVFHLDCDGKVQSKMLRQTMNNIEAQLNVYPFIIRCHRAFIVNLQHVRHASTSNAGLQLSLDVSSLSVPVSKTYISIVKARLG